MESPINSSTLIAVTFSTDTLVTSLSDGMESFSGHSNRKIVGRPITQFLADRTVFQIPNILGAAKKVGRWEGEIVFRDEDGDEIKTHGTIMLLSDCEGKHSGYLLLSKRIKSPDSSKRSGSVHADVGSRIRALVHDLNNPLAVIMGSTQLMVLNSSCTEKVRSDIEKLYTELEKMARVVEKLHAYALSLCDADSEPAIEKESIQHSA